MGMQIDTVADTVWDLMQVDNGVLSQQLKLHPRSLKTLALSDWVMQIETRLGTTKCDLLRVFGHGNSGLQTVGGGHGVPDNPDFTRFRGQALMMASGELNSRKLLQRLTGRFSPTARVELHGCLVGSGAAGRKLVFELARLWRVPVRAAYDYQKADAAFAYEGKFIEIFLNGTTREYDGSTFAVLPSQVPDRPTIVLPPIDLTIKEIHTVGAKIERKDWLSVLADKHYGNQLFWPLIWHRNKSATFKSPNKMTPGQKIVIPVKPHMTKEQESSLKREGLDWKRYD
jgi:hypothetical protein